MLNALRFHVVCGAMLLVPAVLRVAPPAELAPIFVWSAWVLPIVAAEVIFALRRMAERNRALQTR